MDKLATLKESYRSAFLDEMEKMALDIGDLEESLGIYLSDRQEEVARDLIAKEKVKSFALRHPILTGISTLGIAPMIAHNRAGGNVIRSMSKTDSGIRSAISRGNEKKHELAVASAGASQVNQYNYADKDD